MPAYEYCCDKCNNRFTVTRSMDSRAKQPACPRCKSTATRQVLSTFYAKTIKKS